MQIKPPDIDETDAKSSDRDIDEFSAKRKVLSYKEERWFYNVRIGFLIFTSAASLIVVGIYMWHLVAPCSWCWLSDAGLVRLKDLALTIIVGAVSSSKCNTQSLGIGVF